MKRWLSYPSWWFHQTIWEKYARQIWNHFRKFRGKRFTTKYLFSRHPVIIWLAFWDKVLPSWSFVATHSVVSATLGGYRCEAQGNTRDCLSEWVKTGRNEKVWRLGKRESHQAFLILSLTKAASQNVQTKLFITNVTHIQLKFARLPQIHHKKKTPQKNTHIFFLHFFHGSPIFFPVDQPGQRQTCRPTLRRCITWSSF